MITVSFAVFATFNLVAICAIAYYAAEHRKQVRSLLDYTLGVHLRLDAALSVAKPFVSAIASAEYRGDLRCDFRISETDARSIQDRFAFAATGMSGGPQ